MAESGFRYYRNEIARERGIEIKIPRAEDAGLDLPSLDDITILPGGSAVISTGIHVAIPLNWVGIIKDRSSVASKGGVTAAGVIDSGYRGEVKVLLYNLGEKELTFKPGDRIAQLITLPHMPYDQSLEVKTLEDLGDTERGHGGFGSTGR